MRRPDLVADIGWCALVAALAALDSWREDEDIREGRTHSDGTTFSAFNRRVVETVPGGRVLFPLALDALHRWYLGHILGHLDSRPARW